jgi:hypothetical protein
MGCRWKIGNGKSVRFWEDIWLGSSSLAIQYWEIYYLVNEQNKSVEELWDGQNLKCTFPRCVDIRLYNLWEEVVSLASSINFSGADDEMVWQHNSSGMYSSQSLYSIINFRGMTLVYLSDVWKLLVPPRIHSFLWLVSHNKLLTRDNLEKRRALDDSSCFFCNEKESVKHLLFECVVAQRAWGVVSDVLGFDIGSDYESIAKKWPCNTKFGFANVIVC